MAFAPTGSGWLPQAFQALSSEKVVVAKLIQHIY